MESKRFFAIPDPLYPNLFTCLIAVGDTDYIFRASKDPIYFEAESKLIALVKGKEKNLKKELERLPTIDDFCQRILYFISQLVPENQNIHSQPPSAFFETVRQEAKLIGWNLISKIDPALTFIEVSIADDHDRKVVIRFDFDPAFPRIPPKFISNLPKQVKFEWYPNSSHLSQIVELHQKKMQVYQTLWNQLSDLDENSYVIEPHEPSLSCCMRRIVLNSLVQLQIEVSSERPTSIPKVYFIGAEKESKKFDLKFKSNLNLWNHNKSLRENLETLLELNLPKQDNKEFEGVDLDCAICYTERLGAELPEIVCEKCLKHFHYSCLSSWFLSRSNAEQSSSSVYGPCPFCDNIIQYNMTNQK